MPHHKIRNVQDILREFTKEQREVKQTAKEFAEGEFKDRAEELEQGRGTWSRD
jgi:hypothetical protein